MQELKMVIVPSETETRLWGRTSHGTTRLRAKLPPEPTHPQALPRLLEALGRFLPVHAALVVGARQPSFATRL